MTIHIKNGSIDTSISRRGFVAGAAGMTFAFTLGGLGRGGAALGADAADRVQRLCQHRRRQHHHHRLPGRRNGAGRVHLAAVDPGGRARRRLVEGEGGIRAGQSEGLRQQSSPVQRRADHRGERLGRRLFHAAAHGRRAGAQGADRCGGGEMESAGERAHHLPTARSSTTSRGVSAMARSCSSRPCRPSRRRSPKPISRSRRSSS